MISRSVDRSKALPRTGNDFTSKSKAFVTPSELAAYLDVHPQTIYRQIRKGALRVVRVGRVIRIRVTDALKYAQPVDSEISDRRSSRTSDHLLSGHSDRLKVPDFGSHTRRRPWSGKS